jgi:photosystem II stability/assembly factor-like uncharacterized protein
MLRNIAIVSLGLCAAVDAAHAQRAPAPAAQAAFKPAIDTALFRGMRFRLVGPSRGGRVTTVTGVPSEPRTFYMGVASGGVFRTRDGGETWQPITDGKVPVGSTGSIAVADSDPKIIYLGTGSDGVRSNVSTGRGVYLTRDAGDSWQFAGLYEAGQIGAVRIHPTNPDVVWVSAMGDAFKPNRERGIFKSTNAGATWRKTLFVSDSTGAMDVELQPGNPNVVYAWMSRLERKPWTIISGSREGGFFKSVDGGETWKQIRNGLPAGLIGKANLAVTAANPNRIYALIEAKPDGGLYRSDDAGESWQLVNAQGALLQRPFYYTTLGADPTNADVVYAGAESFFKSVDGGKTMTGMRTPHGDNHDIWVSPRDGRTMIQANDGGANVSFDGGRTWSSQNNQPTAEFYGVIADNQFPYRIYGAQQDASTVIISSVAAPMNLNDWRSGPGCETGPIMPHPLHPDTVYGSCKGQYERMSLRSGVAKPYWIGAQSLYGNAGGDLIYRMQRTSPMDISPHDPNVIYYGSQYVHRTRDEGVTWERISPDLTAFPPCCQGASGEPITRDVTGEEFYSTLYAIRESKTERGVIWTGANDGPFHVTRDNGRTWTNITPQDLPAGGRVQYLEPSPHRKGSAYYAVYRYLLGDYKPYIYRTDDYGKSWKLLTNGRNGIPADWPTRVVREDPDREGLLYAGTEFGLFISYDNGAQWQPFQLNLPATPVTDINVHNKDLIVATQGRSFWVLDNLSAVQQLAPASTSQEIRLFKPRDGYRTRTSPNTLGPMIEFYLPAPSPDSVAIDIMDAGGRVVNHYTSAAPARQGPPAAPAAPTSMEDSDDAPAPRGGTAGTRVSNVAGLNRFVWPVQNDAGVLMTPGRYQARLTVAGRSWTEPFSVLMDPRSAADGVTLADLTEQYEHNMRVRDLVNDVNRTLTRVRNAQRQAAEGSAERKAADAAAAILLTEPVRYGKPGLQAHITYLASLTARTDMKIGRDAIERHGVLRKELDAVVAALDRAIGQTGR